MQNILMAHYNFDLKNYIHNLPVFHEMCKIIQDVLVLLAHKIYGIKLFIIHVVLNTIFEIIFTMAGPHSYLEASRLSKSPSFERNLF